MFRPFGGAIRHQDRRRRGHDEGDADDRLLRDLLDPHPCQREEGGSDDREGQAEERRAELAGVVAEGKADHRSERRELGHREIHEENPTLDDVDPEVGVEAHQHQARGKRRGHETQHGCHCCGSPSAKAVFKLPIHRSTRSK